MNSAKRRKSHLPQSRDCNYPQSGFQMYLCPHAFLPAATNSAAGAACGKLLFLGRNSTFLILLGKLVVVGGGWGVLASSVQKSHQFTRTFSRSLSKASSGISRMYHILLIERSGCSRRNKENLESPSLIAFCSSEPQRRKAEKMHV